MDWIYSGHASQFCTRLLPRCLGAQTKHKSVEIRNLALGKQRNSGEWVGRGQQNSFRKPTWELEVNFPRLAQGLCKEGTTRRHGWRARKFSPFDSYQLELRVMSETRRNNALQPCHWGLFNRP